MITIHHLGVSQSDRIVWLMEELGLPYKLTWYDRDPKTGGAPKEYLALHPTATAPVITDGDLVLTDSNAIVEYICQRYAQGKLCIAPDNVLYPDYLYWMQYHNHLLSVFFGKSGLSGEGAESGFAKILQRREDSYYQHLNNHLAASEFLVGNELTCADILIMFDLTTFPLFGGKTLEGLDHVQAYVERVSARPAYQKAMALAGPSAKNPNA